MVEQQTADFYIPIGLVFWIFGELEILSQVNSSKFTFITIETIMSFRVEFMYGLSGIHFDLEYI